MKFRKSTLKRTCLLFGATVTLALANSASAALMFSYQQDLSEAQTVAGNQIEARQIYLFDGQYRDSVTIECCDWLQGPGSRHQGNIESRHLAAAQALAVDLSSRSSGTRLAASLVYTGGVEDAEFTIVRAQDFVPTGLTASGPVVADHDGQIIENLRIDAGEDVRCAIEVKGYRDVVIRNVLLSHKNIGICAKYADNIRVEHVRVVSSSAPESGPHCRPGYDYCLWDKSRRTAPDLRLNMRLRHSNNAHIEFVEFEKGASGLVVYNSHDVKMYDIRCLDIRGPAPRGNCVIFGFSSNGSLKNFYAKNSKDTSGEHDVVNFFQSDYGTVSHGLIDGTYSINGAGVIADRGSDYLTVTDVDFANTSNTAVSVSTSRSHDTVGHGLLARNIRVRDTSCETRLGVAPSSGSLVVTVHPASDNPVLEDYIYWNHCRKYAMHCLHQGCRGPAGGEGGNFDIREQEFELREPLQLLFSWQQEEPVADELGLQ